MPVARELRVLRIGKANGLCQRGGPTSSLMRTSHAGDGCNNHPDCAALRPQAGECKVVNLPCHRASESRHNGYPLQTAPTTDDENSGRIRRRLWLGLSSLPDDQVCGEQSERQDDRPIGDLPNLVEFSRCNNECVEGLPSMTMLSSTIRLRIQTNSTAHATTSVTQPLFRRQPRKKSFIVISLIQS